MWKTALKKFEVIWSAYFEFFKGCLPQISLGPFLNTLSHIIPFSNRERKLKADQFIMDNHEHLKILKDFGISIHKGDDGKVQLMHQAANVSFLQ